MDLEKEKQSVNITNKGILTKLEYENKLLRKSLTISSIIVSVLISTLTVMVLSGIRG